ncbi:hypothetical protein ACROYT_G015256 [Oculina patagonica]
MARTVQRTRPKARAVNLNAIQKLEQTSNNSIIAIISNKKLFGKARFSPTAIEEFERTESSLPDVFLSKSS